MNEEQTTVQIVHSNLIFGPIFKEVARNKRKWTQFVQWAFQMVNRRFSKLIDSAYWFTIRRIRIDIEPGFMWTYIRVCLPDKAVNTVHFTVKSLLFFKTKCRATTLPSHSIVHCYGGISPGSPLPILPAWFSGSVPPLVGLLLSNYFPIENNAISLLTDHQSTIQHLWLAGKDRWEDCMLESAVFANFGRTWRQTTSDFSKILLEIKRIIDGKGLAKLKKFTLILDCDSVKTDFKDNFYGTLTAIQPRCIEFVAMLTWLTDPHLINAIQLSHAKCLKISLPLRGAFDNLTLTFSNIESLCFECFEDIERISEYEMRWHHLSTLFPRLQKFALKFTLTAKMRPDIFEMDKILKNLCAISDRLQSIVVCINFTKMTEFFEFKRESWYTVNQIVNMITKKFPNTKIEMSQSGDVRYVFANKVTIYFHTIDRRYADVRCACFGQVMFSGHTCVSFEACTHYCFCEHF